MESHQTVATSFFPEHRSLPTPLCPSVPPPKVMTFFSNCRQTQHEPSCI